MVRISQSIRAREINQPKIEGLGNQDWMLPFVTLGVGPGGARRWEPCLRLTRQHHQAVGFGPPR